MAKTRETAFFMPTVSPKKYHVKKLKVIILIEKATNLTLHKLPNPSYPNLVIYNNK